MPQASLIGTLVFAERAKQMIEIPKGKHIAKDCGTTSWVYCIQGELSGDNGGSFDIDVSIQQSVHRFHDEVWSVFNFCNIWRENIGEEGERLVGPGRGHHPDWCDIHSRCPDPKKKKWIYDLSEDMKQFELALFDRQGRWTSNTCPLNYDLHAIGVRATAAVVFAPNKGFRAILESIVTECNLLGTSPRYWKYTGDTTPYHWKDGGLCLTEDGRWRSISCLWFIKKNGWGHVPESIYEEMRSLVDALPEDQSQSSAPPPKATWTERAPLQRKRQHEQPSNIVTPVNLPVEPRSTEMTLHDNIRHRLFSDSMQRQLFAQHVPQRPPMAAIPGASSGPDTAPTTEPRRTASASAKGQPNNVAAVVDLTTVADDAARTCPHTSQQEVTGVSVGNCTDEPSASNLFVDEQLQDE